MGTLGVCGRHRRSRSHPTRPRPAWGFERRARRRSVVAVLRLAAPDFALQLAQQSAGVDEVVIEDSAGHLKQLADERVAHRVTHRQAFLLRGNNALVSQYRQLLGDGRLIERQRVLQLLNRTAAAHEGFEQSDARRVRQRAKELRLEGGELPDSGWVARSASARRWHRRPRYYNIAI